MKKIVNQCLIMILCVSSLFVHAQQRTNRQRPSRSRRAVGTRSVAAAQSSIIPKVSSIPQSIPGLTSDQIDQLTLQEYKALQAARNDREEYAQLLSVVLNRLNAQERYEDNPLPIRSLVVEVQKEPSFVEDFVQDIPREFVLEDKKLFHNFTVTDGIELYEKIFLMGKYDGLLISDSDNNLKAALMAMNQAMALLRIANEESLKSQSFWKNQWPLWENVYRAAQRYEPFMSPSKYIFTGKQRLRRYYRAKKLMKIAETMTDLVSDIQENLSGVLSFDLINKFKIVQKLFLGLSERAQNSVGESIDFTDDLDFKNIGLRGAAILESVAKKLFKNPR